MPPKAMRPKSESFTSPLAKSRYALKDIAEYARRNHPSAFELLSRVSRMRFQTAQCTDAGVLAPIVDAEVLCIATYNTGSRSPSLYARLYVNRVRYYCVTEKTPGQLEECTERFFDAHVIQFFEPLCFVSPNGLKAPGDPRMRNRVELVIKYAFLLTGRVNYIESINKDFLRQFDEVCLYMQETQDGKNERTTAPEQSPLQQVETEKSAVKVEQKNQNIQQPASQTNTMSLITQGPQDAAQDHTNRPNFFKNTLEAIIRFQSDLEVDIAREKKDLSNELESLKAKLKEQTQSTIASEGQFQREKRKREDAEKANAQTQKRFRAAQEEVTLYKNKLEKLRDTMRKAADGD
ncbi:hypothetical protein GQ44DRAFT_772628 [Phaeosphaeriaceae sp. PMI808]|nr:hypothetical protein GQ44DRAFT_772628 [Phaeosphaeriaceae sp. PMI808]